MRKQQYRSMPRRSRQRGSILIVAAVGMALIISMLAVIDIGFMYYYKREYQKTADLAALSGAKRLISLEDGSRSCSSAEVAAQASAAQNLGDKGSLNSLQCGMWAPAGTPEPDCVPGSTDPRLNVTDPNQANVVRAVVSGTPPSWFLPGKTLAACANALTVQPLAQLTIRSGLISINSEQSALLNSVVGGLLGGNITLQAVSWTGLLNTDVNLLSYLDALALKLGLDAGSYEQALSTDVTLRQLLEVAADVLERGKGTGEVAVAVDAIGRLLASLPSSSPLLQLGELIGISTGTPASALDLGLNVLDLVQGGVMLANGDSVATVNLPVVGIKGLTTVSAKIKVIEPPMPSAIGNPALAKADPFGPDRIYVRTAQIRSLLTVDVKGLSDLVTQLNNVVMPLLSPIINFLNTAGFSDKNLIDSVGSLLQGLIDLIAGLGCALGCQTNWTESNVIYAEALAKPLQISLDAAGANAYVSDYDCTGKKSLDAPPQTSLAHLRIGSMTEEAVFSSSAPPLVKPVSIIEIGYREVRARRTCGLLFTNCTNEQQWRQKLDGSWGSNMATARTTVISGLGIKVDAPVGQSPTPLPTLVFESPNLPEIWEEPAYKPVSTNSVVGSLATTLQHVTIQPYASEGNGLLGNLLNGTLLLLGDVVTGLQGVISNVLAKALDPVLNTLLPTLGVSLATADVGANLTCEGGGAALVD
jgi:uncharacterized membrane protein